jgi:hypothetical protein
VNFMSSTESEHDAWCQAVVAIDAGDVQRLQLLIAAHPRLATDRLDGSPEWLRQQLGDAADGHAATLQEQLDSTLRLVCWSGVAAEYGVTSKESEQCAGEWPYGRSRTPPLPRRHYDPGSQELPRIFATRPHPRSKSNADSIGVLLVRGRQPSNV